MAVRYSHRLLINPSRAGETYSLTPIIHIHIHISNLITDFYLPHARRLLHHILFLTQSPPPLEIPPPKPLPPSMSHETEYPQTYSYCYEDYGKY